MPVPFALVQPPAPSSRPSPIVKISPANQLTTLSCLAHARRKFDELIKDNLNTVGTQAIQRIAALYKIERKIKGFSAKDRHETRQSSAKPLCKDLHEWLKLERQRVPEGSATAKAIAYSLNRWSALTAYLDNGAVQIDNNHNENLIRPWAMGRKA